ncbi:DUF3114 domain-containing protein [Enterococcus sp. LJL99]
MNEKQNWLESDEYKLERSLKKVNQLKAYGWDQAAIDIYMKETTNLNENEANISGINQQQFLVGSQLYEKMFKASQLANKAKIQLVIGQLGIGFDEHHDLVTFQKPDFYFDPMMPPGSSFLIEFAQIIQQAYPDGLLTQKEDKHLSKSKLRKKYPLETMIHQFRHQIDQHNIKFIETYRREKKLKTDELAIKEVLVGKWFYADPQYHNRALLGIDIENRDLKKQKRVMNIFGWIKKLRRHGFNRKILSNDYHSEFIIDESGMLISQWRKKSNEEKMYAIEMPIMNGESFNYGERPAGDKKRSHHFLDGLPAHYFDSTKRNEIKSRWISPDDTFIYQITRRLSEKGIRFKRN